MDLDGGGDGGGTGRSRGRENHNQSIFHEKYLFSIRGNDRMAFKRQKGKKRKQKW